ncbi:hypothetical protein [Chamaesiphon sp. VAR_69_metabat_338]|uniref:hypothetical protein n=1 Tax=Chamaesiphon sp. VAR_69_metabat_338 TaxID=2964704 RepID=UPI00286DA644|nr:hypothetical protein [Chamaesiphon sp. VAR_69_metabat_338]
MYVDVGLDFPDFNRFRQFELAYNAWRSWRVDAYLISENNQQMKSLLIQCGEINKKWIKSIEPDAGFCRICRFCLSVFNVKTSKDKWKSCGSPKCVKAYSAATTRKSSNQPHALNKKSKKPASQWVKVDNTHRCCAGTCGKRRLVDVEQICKKFARSVAMNLHTDNTFRVWGNLSGRSFVRVVTR